MAGCEAGGVCCDRCVMEFYGLIDQFIEGIQHLESKAVCLRYLLSKHLPEHDGEMLRCDIFHDLSGAFWAHPAYQSYISEHCRNVDPMDNGAYNDLLVRLSQGKAFVGL